MADETKNYLLKVESNLKPLIDDAVKAKKAMDEFRESLEALKKAGASPEEIEAATAAYKNANDEYRKAASLVKTQIAANSSEVGSRKQLGEQLKLQEQALGKLGNAYIINAKGQRELNPLHIENRKQIAATKQAIIDYDRALKDGRSNIGRYGESVQASFKSMGSSILSSIGPVALLTAGLGKLKEAFTDTELGARVMSRVGQYVKTIFQSVFTGTTGTALTMAGIASDVAKELDKLRIEERKDLLEIAKLENDIRVSRFKSVDAMSSQEDQLKNLNKAQEDENKIIEIKKEHLLKEIDLYAQLLITRPDDTKLYDIFFAKQIEYEQLEGERSFRLESRKSKILEKQKTDGEKALKQKQDEAIATEELIQKETKIIEDAAKKRAAIKLAEQDLVDEETKLMGERAKARYEKEIQAGFEYQNIKAQGNLDMLDTLLDQEYGYWLASVDLATIGTNQKLLADQQYTEAKKRLSELRIEQERSEYAATANVFGGLSELLGKQTEEGKGFAIAQATINTWLGVTEVLAEQGISTYEKFIKIAAVIIEGLLAVKNITAVDTSGSSRGVSVATPTAISSSATAQRAMATPAGSTVFTQPQLSQTQLNALPSAGSLTAEDIRNIVRNMPNPKVSVEDINAKIKEGKKIEVRATI
jgi:hypothetical protein